MNDDDWNEHVVETEVCNMAGGHQYYSLEELYQLFKQRLVEELESREE